MNAVIDKAIETLAARITNDTDKDEAMRLTQAALNLAHVKAVLSNVTKS